MRVTCYTVLIFSTNRNSLVVVHILLFCSVLVYILKAQYIIIILQVAHTVWYHDTYTNMIIIFPFYLSTDIYLNHGSHVCLCVCMCRLNHIRMYAEFPTYSSLLCRIWLGNETILVSYIKRSKLYMVREKAKHLGFNVIFIWI